MQKTVEFLVRLIGPGPEDWILDILMAALIVLLAVRGWSWFGHG